METFWQDLKYGARMLAKSPGFTAVAILTLALGIGANTAVFSVINAMLLRPLPYKEPDRLVMVWSTAVSQGIPLSNTAPPDYRAWRDQNRAFEGMAAFDYGSFNLSFPGQEPERVQGARITASLFPLLGVKPGLGRTFLPEEEQFGHHRVVTLSDGLWQQRFGSDPNIVGRGINLGGEIYTVVGIMPQGIPFFDNLPPVDLWVALAFPPGDNMNTRNNRFLVVIARLQPQATLEQAQAEMTTIARRIEQEYKENVGYSARVVPLREQLVENVRPALLVLLGAVGFVLLVVCVNVANLMLARALTREKEFAVRAALGAGRTRLIRQVLIESVPLGLLGGGAGILLAAWGMDSLISLVPSDLPRFNKIAIDGSVLAFTLGISLLTALLFGLVPAFQTTKADAYEALKEGARSATQSRRRGDLRRLLVVSELALALMLLIGAGLMLKSFALLRQVDPGFSANNVLTMQIPLPNAKYPLPDREHLYPQQAITFFEQLLERVEALPGVQAAGVSTTLPLRFGAGWNKYIRFEGRPAPTSLEQVPLVWFQLVSPHHFRAIGARLRAGRLFTELDNRQAPPVAIINEALARRFFLNEDPVGKTIVMNPPDNLLPPIPPGSPRAPRRMIIGVIADIKNISLNQEAQPEVYVPYMQCEAEGWFNSMRLAVQSTSDPRSLAAAVRAQVSAIDPEQPVARAATMGELLGQSLSRSRFNMLLLNLFAALALLLAAVGIYGVISSSVTQRTHEIGIRLALGAQPRDVLKLIVGQGMVFTLIGVGMGLAGALALSTLLMSSLLYSVSATDPLTFVVIALLLVGVALVACYLPARRATKVDPMVALRYE